MDTLMSSQEAEEFILNTGRYSRTKPPAPKRTLASFRRSDGREVTVELKYQPPRIWLEDGVWLSESVRALFSQSIKTYKRGAARQSNIKSLNVEKEMVRIGVPTLGLLAKLLAAYEQIDWKNVNTKMNEDLQDMQIRKGFGWVPFYEEMALSLMNYRNKQPILVEILKDALVNGLTDQMPKGNKVILTEIDPFTFLALLNKQSPPERTRILASIKPKLGITASVPGSEDFLGIPTADARQTWLFPYLFQRNPDDVDKLWNLYEAVLSGEKVSDKLFADARSVKYAGHAKLTQAIFRAAPKRFFPVDGQTTSYLAALRLPYQFNSGKEFQRICAQVQKLVAKPLYEQSHDAWSANQKSAPGGEVEFQKQVLREAAKPAKPIVEKKGGVALPKIGKAGLSGKGYQRNPSVAAEAIRLAKFKCEIDGAHPTFISNAKDKPYVEAHHLIPFGNQGGYPFSLDVTANVVALCPNCHRRLHHGRGVDKITEIKTLLNLRKVRLLEKELKIGEKELLNLYSGELGEEDD